MTGQHLLRGPSGTGYPFADAGLARRLEGAEASANITFVEARARLQPEVRASWMEVAGVHAMFDGPQSPLTQTFGLGLSGSVDDAAFDALEDFFAERGAEVHHEVSPFVDGVTLLRLGTRGYRPVEFSSVLVRPAGADRYPEPDIRVRVIAAGEADLWTSLSVEGWGAESPALGEFMNALGRVFVAAERVSCFVAEREGRSVATAALCLHDGVALLAGASTIPAARGRGAQAALLQARLRFASERGAELAMMVAQPGSGSQRNAERHGFRIVYTRTKWRGPVRDG